MRKTHTDVQTDEPRRTGSPVRGPAIYRPLSRGWCHARLRCSRGLRLTLVSGSFAAIGVGVLGCGSDAATAPSTQSNTHTFWALQLNQHAVNLALQAPYNTMQLIAIPMTVTGMPLAGVGSATFHGSDSSVTVDAKTGRMTAHYVTALTQVVATLTVQGVTLADTAYVQVTGTAPQNALTTLSLQPVSGDSAKRSGDFVARNRLSWPATATDVAHNIICSASGGCPLLIYYTSSNPTILCNACNGNSPLSSEFYGSIGQTMLTATTWAYGVAKRDSVVFTVGYLINYELSIDNTGVDSPNGGRGLAEPRKIVLGVGAIVDFHNNSDHKTGITFVDTTGVDSATSVTDFGESVPPSGPGNIAVFGVDTINDFGVSCAAVLRPGDQSCYIKPTNYRARRFRLAKNYKFFATLFPADTFEFDVR